MTKLLVPFVLLFLISCGGKEVDKVKISASAGPLPVEKGEDITIQYTDSGNLKATVIAPQLERYSNEERMQSIMKKGIFATFFNEQGDTSSYLKSDYAIRDERDRTLTVKKNVLVVNDQGDTIRTEELIWDEKTDIIRTDKFVSIHSPDKIIYGTGLETKTDFKKPKIFNIKGIVYVKQ
ncbi:MAG: LPS export ABC transporter periplasmic protein LptC [Bacteroidetes bacterium]|nr:LPS export ABC transporter periplasmic protein LptC [Bacteroidota bacterium]MCK6610917.1 LPS export ABC transporter periplasmic protein LptC [Bacteroidia bacterium]